jgi:hypothetical protein
VIVLYTDTCWCNSDGLLWDPRRGFNKGERVESLDCYVEHLTWKKLPREVLEIYGGYDAAKKRRKEMQFDKPPVTDVSVVSASIVDSSVNTTTVADPGTAVNSREGLRQQYLHKGNSSTTAAPIQEVLSPMELAKRKLIGQGALKQKAEHLESTFSTISVIRDKMVLAVSDINELADQRVDDNIACKKPCLTSDTSSSSLTNYCVPNVTWQLLDIR